jgi:hypothetical protein
MKIIFYFLKILMYPKLKKSLKYFNFKIIINFQKKTFISNILKYLNFVNSYII